MPEFFDPSPEEQNIVLVDARTLRQSEKLIDSCEHCNPEGAEIPFDAILDRVTGSDPSATDYILELRQSARTAGERFSKRHSSNQSECLPQPLLPLVRRLLGLGVRLCALFAMA